MSAIIRFALAACVAQTMLPVADISATLGRAGTAMAGDVYRVAFPRSDLHVRIGNITLAPGFALGGYAAFKMEGNTTLAVGDLVLLENEIAPVMGRLEGSGFQITALHNHLRNETPHVMYLHFMGTGTATGLATALHEALSLSKTPLGPLKTAISTMPWFAATIQQGLGYQGRAANGVLSISVPRADAVTMNGYAIPPSMGVAIVMNFESVGATRIATTGDFVLVASEVATVERSLQTHGFDVTALHHHMLGDEPRLYYMHFWSVQPPASIAAGLKDALSHVNAKSP